MHWGAPNGRLQRRFPFWRPHARELGRPSLARSLCSFAPLTPSFILPRSPTSLPWIGQVLTFDENKKQKNRKI